MDNALYPHMRATQRVCWVYAPEWPVPLPSPGEAELPEAVCSAPTDMYRPGPIHNTGRDMVAGFAIKPGTYRERRRDRYALALGIPTYTALRRDISTGPLS